MADEACEVRPAGNRERAFTRIDPNCNLLTQNILIILHDVIVVNNNLSILIRNDIPYWLISTYHQNCEDRFLVKSPWYQRLYTFSSPRNCPPTRRRKVLDQHIDTSLPFSHRQLFYPYRKRVHKSSSRKIVISHQRRPPILQNSFPGIARVNSSP